MIKSIENFWEDFLMCEMGRAAALASVSCHVGYFFGLLSQIEIVLF